MQNTKFPGGHIENPALFLLKFRPVYSLNFMTNAQSESSDIGTIRVSVVFDTALIQTSPGICRYMLITRCVCTRRYADRTFLHLDKNRRKPLSGLNIGRCSHCRSEQQVDDSHSCTIKTWMNLVYNTLAQFSVAELVSMTAHQVRTHMGSCVHGETRDFEAKRGPIFLLISGLAYRKQRTAWTRPLYCSVAVRLFCPI